MWWCADVGIGASVLFIAVPFVVVGFYTVLDFAVKVKAYPVERNSLKLVLALRTRCCCCFGGGGSVSIPCSAVVALVIRLGFATTVLQYLIGWWN